jgi:hypothetical protein
MIRTMRASLHVFVLVFAVWTFLPLQAGAEGYRFSGVERVVAIGDVHGALDELVVVLRGVELVDEELAWIGGQTHLVSLGDLVDRGDRGRQVMDLLMRLQAEAEAAGGAIHIVLGNHEVMNLVGDLRYVSEGDYAQFGSATAGDLPPGYLERRAAFAPDGKYGRWLLDFPVAIAYDDTLFLHGGVSGALDGLSLEDINEASRRDVRRFAEGWHTLLAAGVVADGDDFAVTLERAAELARPGADVGLRQAGVDITEAYDGLPFVRDGPLWYRGSVRCHPFTETEVAKGILEPLEVDRVVVGHTPTHGRRVVSRLDGRVIMLDTGMNVAAYRGRPAALILEDGEARAWYAAEGEQDIPVQPHRAWSRPGDMSDAELEDFLLTAEIAGEEPAAEEGAPRRLVLEKDGLQLGAVFNPVDTLPGLQDGRWTRAAAKAERYHHEIAAYRLDRLLGLQMVPVTVERQIGGQKGALRAWIEGSFSEEERQARQLPVTGSCGLDSQYELVAVFDTLIFNSGHDLGRLRYDREWQLWHMEQSRAFGLTTRNVAGMLRRAKIRPSPQLAAALAEITAENVERLKPYLHPRQLEALLERAEQLRALR